MWGGEKRGVAYNEYRAPFWGDENSLILIMVMVVKRCEYTKTTEWYTSNGQII